MGTIAIPEGLTFDDVLLLPGRSDVLPAAVDTTTRIAELEQQVRAHVVLVDPGIPVSTAAVFHRLDESLTPRENSNTIIHFVSRDLEADGAFRLLSNDLEKAALAEAPALKEKAERMRGVLVREGARLVALSGSGSSYFGLFGDPRAARRAQAALVKEGFTALRARTLSRSEYRKAWFR